MDQIQDIFDRFDVKVWLLVGLCLGTVATLQAIDAAVEGAWPHQRRFTRLPPRARTTQRGWSVVALLLLPGLLLGILNLVVMLWQDVGREDGHLLGALFVGAGWLLFLLATSDRLATGRFLRQLGTTGPLAVAALLVAGDALLLIALIDILPSLDEIRDALPLV